MQFRDLKQQYQVLKKDIDAAMIEVATNCNFINGQQVKDLEKKLAEYVGVRHCITCGNGTDALTMAMMAWGFKEGDAVFVPDFTFFSSGEIVSHAGATPVFVDVDMDTFNISAESLEKAVKKTLDEGILKPQAVVAVDLFGLPADFAAVRAVADKYGLKVLEDGAQGFGGNIEGKVACSFGDISTTSFFPAKPLGCYGDGGAVFTDDDEIAALLESIRVHGKGEMKYDNVRIGLNSRLDTIQAAVLDVKLRAFDDYELVDINKAADRYTEKLSALGEKVKTPVIPAGFYSSWAQYTIQLSDRKTRDDLQAALKAEGIPSMVYYPKPMHRQEAFAGQAYDDAEFPNTLKLCDTVLSLPMHPYLTDEDIDMVVDVIKKFFE
ncbi:UDP-4-amino-4-deoxy-L-arabinose--oxoglutarate aminotransferase [uncultured Eubacterium sp.]|uniref:DegT/DnrJ/EryC1/StrS family aminotransferase n=1 Tax=Brotomerdimonas butyrica TaxID=2981721 RepID=UPI000820D129|nr:DegT/DnrJ/EryC1/StrS family aminotransferase [Brotomerdimonas butyrica]MCU6756086.1 DegT/DnrJ/EryC1/StrS family aminotransferase [Brotomerdimonas butyrica]SCH65496.1 UDP-4-amino-4-deoxy-L-arabinose--oxoglutarate aminotransferase [uncultured Eubacterium sp.]